MQSTHLLRKRENARLQAEKISSLPVLSLSAYLALIISVSCDVASMNVPFLAMLLTINEQSVMSPAAPSLLVFPPVQASSSPVGDNKAVTPWAQPVPASLQPPLPAAKNSEPLLDHRRGGGGAASPLLSWEQG
jgi:hypothetical protein